jgi:hypothetical protein
MNPSNEKNLIDAIVGLIKAATRLLGLVNIAKSIGKALS